MPSNLVVSGGTSDLSDKLGAKLNVTAEIKEIFDEALAYQNCRDACIKGVFSNRRAVYHAKRYIQTSRKLNYTQNNNRG
jgi:hypothetical protein